MNNLFNANSLEKLFFIILAILALQFNVTLGIVIIIVYIYFQESSIEGMSNSTKEHQKSFAKKHCKDGKLELDGKVITPENVVKSFPYIKFTGDNCNPCDSSCDFEILSSSETLTAMENLKSQDSNTIPVNRKKAIQKKE